MMRWLCLISFLCLASTLSAQVSPVPVSDYAFRPDNDEGYIQAWNVDVRTPNAFLYVTLLVSNVGPGDLNNGVSVLVVKPGSSRIWTAEYSVRSLQATPGQFGHRSGLSRIHRDEKGRIILHSEIPGGSPSPKESLNLDLVLTPVDGGLRISGGLLEPEKGSFLRADLPVIAARAEGTLTIGGVQEPLNGIAGLDAIWSNKSPHTYAKRFLLIRSFSEAPGIFIGGFMGKEENFLLRFAVAEKGKVKSSGNVKSLEVNASAIDPFSGYSIPTSVTYGLEDGCKITEVRKGFAGGFDVLGSISTVLRWILRVFFARPYVMHFTSQMTYICNGAKDISAEAQASYYLINR
ncbi:MAG TPA: hypothetical protein PKA91_07885 [Leptospiraceae bacterium]|jgi:hypothetical protein|nr:hypothetical protein [Leptospiraceae bacterium]